MARHEIHHHHEKPAHVEHHHKKRGGESAIEREAHKEHESVAEEKREHEHRKDGGETGTHPTHGGMRRASHGKEMENRGPHPGHPEADHHHPGDKPMHHRRRRGGKSGGDGESAGEEDRGHQIYNAQGSNEMHEAGDETPGFRKGGEARKRRRAGGHAEGHMEHHRLDRRPRRAMGGMTKSHNPYSSASEMVMQDDGKAGRGLESEGQSSGPRNKVSRD